MQIICNSCLSSVIYSHYLNQKYNAFANCIWSPKDMITFIKHYKDLDYTNINLSVVDDLTVDDKKIKCIKCIIDKIMPIYYIHSEKDVNNDFDIFKELYFRRLARLNVNETTLFILGYGIVYRDWYNLPGDDLSYCVKFNTMKANTLQFVPMHYKNYKFNNGDFPLGENNHIIYVDHDTDVLPPCIEENKETWNQVTNIVDLYNR